LGAMFDPDMDQICVHGSTDQIEPIPTSKLIDQLDN
jgi:hypothetical protein